MSPKTHKCRFLDYATHSMLSLPDLMWQADITGEKVAPWPDSMSHEEFLRSKLAP